MRFGATPFYYRAWEAENPKANIVGVHGFAEHSARYSELAEFMVSQGYSFYMYDLRGHGKTAAGNDRGYVSNFSDFVDDTHDFANRIIHDGGTAKTVIYGHSMGGLIVLDYLSRYGSDVCCAITSGPATRMEANAFTKFLLGMMNALSPRSRIKLPIKPENLTHVKEIYEAYASDPLVLKNPTVKLVYELYSGSRSIWNRMQNITTPILMLHGSEDKVVPVSATLEAFERITSGDKQKKIYPGMYHEIHNEVNRNEVLEDISGWIGDHVV